MASTGCLHGHCVRGHIRQFSSQTPAHLARGTAVASFGDYILAALVGLPSDWIGHLYANSDQVCQEAGIGADGNEDSDYLWSCVGRYHHGMRVVLGSRSASIETKARQVFTWDGMTAVLVRAI